MQSRSLRKRVPIPFRTATRPTLAVPIRITAYYLGLSSNLRQRCRENHLKLNIVFINTAKKDSALHKLPLLLYKSIGQAALLFLPYLLLHRPPNKNRLVISHKGTETIGLLPPTSRPSIAQPLHAAHNPLHLTPATLLIHISYCPPSGHCYRSIKWRGKKTLNPAKVSLQMQLKNVAVRRVALYVSAALYSRHCSDCGQNFPVKDKWIH